VEWDGEERHKVMCGMEAEHQKRGFPSFTNQALTRLIWQVIHGLHRIPDTSALP